MPLYEYECTRCGHRFELLQKVSDEPRKRCPECRGKVERLISAPAIRFKGTGWYVTDYSEKGKKKAEKEKAESGKDSGKAESGKDSGKKAEGSSEDSGKKSKEESKGGESAVA